MLDKNEKRAGKDLETYDFTEDWKLPKDLDERKCKLNNYQDLPGIKKYFTYKMAQSNSKVPPKEYEEARKFRNEAQGTYSEGAKGRRRYYIPDPDINSCLLQEIYGELWGENVLQYCTDKKGKIHGDTMNSVQTTLSWYVRFCYEDDKAYYAGEPGNGFVRKNGKKYEGSINQALQIYCEEEKKIPDKKEQEYFEPAKNQDLMEFIRFSHTIGNFMPVPFERGGGSFNAPRKSTTKDFWDLTLGYIYSWYKKNDTSKKNDEGSHCEGNADLCKLLGRKDKNVSLCIRWLKEFDSWDKFVEQNFLQPYVERSGDQKQKYGEPKMLWCNGAYQSRICTGSGNVCRDKEVCEQYFRNAAACIRERTKLMIEKIKEDADLREKLEEEGFII